MGRSGVRGWTHSSVASLVEKLITVSCYNAGVYLKSIELSGFKSFGKKTELVFGPRLDCLKMRDPLDVATNQILFLQGGEHVREF